VTTPPSSPSTSPADFDEGHVFHLKDGKCAELWAVPQDPYAIDDFFSGVT
jgi:hypothetical protein